MLTFVVILVLILAVVAIVQLVRVFELTGEIKERDYSVISLKENKLNAWLMLIFGTGFIIYVYAYIISYKDKMLPISASEHGHEIDLLFDINVYLILIVFTITSAILFWFAFKYYYRPDRKVEYFTHSNKLELIWTLVPSAFLAVIIIFGIKTWNSAMGDAPEDAMVVGLYAKQFDWTVRYSGEDNQLGDSDYHLINETNPLGLDSTDSRVNDDILVKGEFHLPVNKPVVFVMKAQEVIHSMYMPHFRAQINIVPGMTTTFHFTPTMTTEEMRNDPMTKKKVERVNKLRMKAGKEPYEFNYILLCNKICGASHYNMQMDVIVESEEDYKAWLAEQKQVIEVTENIDSTEETIEGETTGK